MFYYEQSTMARTRPDGQSIPILVLLESRGSDALLIDRRISRAGPQKKWLAFCASGMLQLFDLICILTDQMVPFDRDAPYGPIRTGVLHVNQERKNLGVLYG
jgi:hypothetical protein